MLLFHTINMKTNLACKQPYSLQSNCCINTHLHAKHVSNNCLCNTHQPLTHTSSFSLEKGTGYSAQLTTSTSPFSMRASRVALVAFHCNSSAPPRVVSWCSPSSRQAERHKVSGVSTAVSTKGRKQIVGVTKRTQGQMK